MPTSIPIQTSFAGGELSPKLMGRVDAELYKKAVARCENFEPLAHGPMLMRGGTKFARILPGITEHSKIVSFPRQGEVGFLLLMGDRTIRVLDAKSGAETGTVGGAPVQTNTIDWLSNPVFGPYGWQYWDRNPALLGIGGMYEVVSGKYCLVRNVPGFSTYLRQLTPSLAAGQYQLTVRLNIAGGQHAYIKVGTGTPPAGTNGDGPMDLLFVDQVGQGLTIPVEVKRTITVVNPGPIYVGVMPLNGSMEFFDGKQVGIIVNEISLQSSTTGDVTWSVPWLDSQIREVQIVKEAANDWVMFFHPAHPPQELLYGESGSWTFRPITFLHGTFPAWEAPNYPGVAELFQGRLFLGGIGGELNRFIASRSGVPYDFVFGGSNADDPFDLSVSTKGAIRWMQGHRALLIGTDLGELVAMAQGGVMTPSDFEVRPQSGFGSAAIQANQVGDQVFYVSRDKRRIRMLSYNLQENGWQTRDLTFTSEHMTGGQVREIHWISTGNDQVVTVMESGEVMCWSFNRPEAVVAPWRATFGGVVHSMAVVDVGDKDLVWLLVSRVGGVALEEWHVADVNNRVLLDSYVIGDGTGLSHLEGQTVVPIVDDVVQAPTVVTGGEIVVSPASTNVIVGLFSTPRRFTTLKREGGNANGTTQGARQRAVKLSLRINDSSLPLVNGVRCGPDRTPATLMDTVEGRVTLDAPIRVLGWEDGAAVTVSQDLPIRTEVLAMFSIVSTNEVL